MNSSVVKLLRAVRKASGYDKFHIWEPGTDYDQTNPNYPFKAQFMETHPDRQRFADLADAWDGGLSDWDHALKKGRVGHVFDFYVTQVNDELVTNIEVWVKSDREVIWSDCGGPEKTIML